MSDDLEPANVYAWRCEVCHRFRRSTIETPMMLLVAEPGPVVELAESLRAPFVHRTVIACKRCRTDMETPS